jgi:hypothetical protein
MSCSNKNNIELTENLAVANQNMDSESESKTHSNSLPKINLPNISKMAKSPKLF